MLKTIQNTLHPIKPITGLCTNLELISVYDYGSKSVPEQMYYLTDKVNKALCMLQMNDKTLEQQIIELQKEIDALKPTQTESKEV